MAEPPAYVQEAALDSVTRVYSRVDIYESDGETPWQIGVPLLEGSVSVDQGRTERRIFEATFDNTDGLLDHDPDGGFWYDKVIKPYRGIYTDRGRWEMQLGEFLIDGLEDQDFPQTMHVTCRDYTKKLMNDKFLSATTFGAGQAVEDICQVIAVNAGIVKFNFATTGKELTQDFTFDVKSTRWDAINKIATAHGHEVFFDAEGVCVLREFQDPAVLAESFTFETGEEGSLIRVGRRAGDSRLFNVILVTGANAGIVPVTAVARNDNADSPSRVGRIGARVFSYDSEFITTYEQAQDVANKFLKVYALEEFELTVESVVIPWLEGGDVVKILDPDQDSSLPIRYLLSNFTIPLGLGSMSLVGKRVLTVHPTVGVLVG